MSAIDFGPNSLDEAISFSDLNARLAGIAKPFAFRIDSDKFVADGIVLGDWLVWDSYRQILGAVVIWDQA